MTPFHVLNYGAGVQSTTMLYLAIAGDIKPRPDAVMFADTGDEPQQVYDQVKRAVAECARVDIPFYIVSQDRRLSDAIVAQHEDGSVLAADGGDSYIAIPAFGDRGGMGRRQCTREFKIEPLDKKCRELMGYKPYQRIPAGSCVKWIGISTDEASRMKDSRTKWVVSRWPLIELRMSRRDCVIWLEEHGHPVPSKSSCIFCPYKSRKHWRDIKQDPVAWPKVVQIDRQINKIGEYLHRSLKPIDEVDFDSLEDKGQINMFENECEGVCGV